MYFMPYGPINSARARNSVKRKEIQKWFTFEGLKQASYSISHTSSKTRAVA